MIIRTREINDVVIFDIDGEFRRSDVKEPSLPEFVKAQLDNGKKKFLINIEKAEFVDSFGVGEIMASYISVHNLGGALKLAPFPGKLFNYCIVDFNPPREFIYTSVETALEAFGPSNNAINKNAVKKWWQFWKL